VAATTGSYSVVVTNASGCNKESNVIDVTVLPSTTTGVQGMNTLEANVYPNPASEELIIESPEDLSDAEIKVLDVMGNEMNVKFFSYNIGAQLNTSDLYVGTYFLIIKKEKLITRIKFTIIK
jgi:hypothetical protein